MYFLLNLSHYVEGYGHLCQFLAFFTMTALQIWPCHVIQGTNFENILFFPNSAFNIRKRYKTSSRKALFFFRNYQPKTSRGVENTSPHSAFRVNTAIEQLKMHGEYLDCKRLSIMMKNFNSLNYFSLGIEFLWT